MRLKVPSPALSAPALAALLAMTALGTGCASTLSTFQTATPAKRGQVQVTGGAGIYLPLGPVGTVVKQGIAQGRALNESRKSGEPFELSPEDQQELLTAGLALAIMAPWPNGINYEMGVRTGVLREDMDVGFRYAMNSVRLDTKYRYFSYVHNEHLPEHKRMNIDLAANVGVSKYLFANPAFEVLEYIKLDDFSRWDVEAVPLIYTVDFGDIFKLYGGAKYVYSHTSMDTRLVNYSQHATHLVGADVGLPREVTSHFFGATAGISAGYKYAHLMLELTGGYTHCKPFLFGQHRQLGGATFYPGLGLRLQFP